MKYSHLFRRTGAIVCAGALVLSLLPLTLAADTSPAVSSNINKEDYTTWSKPVTSYLYENEKGGLTRVEYTGGQVVVENYSSSFALQDSRTIQPELPIWGGFFAGEDYNFLVFGQQNSAESDSTEVIRVVKYDKNWNRLGAASLKGANTTVPFDAGSLRCDEYNGYLYIRTSHEMYTSSDGLNHQSNLTMAVRQSDMSITDSYYKVMNINYSYVSHSFNQFILVDEDGKIIALDHGDAYPRSAVLTGSPPPAAALPPRWPPPGWTAAGCCGTARAAIPSATRCTIWPTVRTGSPASPRPPAPPCPTASPSPTVTGWCGT